MHQYVYNAFRFSSELDVYAYLHPYDDEDIYKREKTPQYYSTTETEAEENLDIFNHDPSNYFTTLSKAVFCLFD